MRLHSTLVLSSGLPLLEMEAMMTVTSELLGGSRGKQVQHQPNIRDMADTS